MLRYSPQYYAFIANSTNVVFNNFDISGYSSSSNEAKNTDGWDTYRSSDITIMNSVINNGDGTYSSNTPSNKRYMPDNSKTDCVSFKPNSTNILVESLWCNGSHGISVGSLGQYPGEFDIVENVFVTNISMHNASDGARIKVWPNVASELSGDLQGGGGSGRVDNITYDGMEIDNVDYAIEITQCYGQSEYHPSPMTNSRLPRFGIFQNASPWDSQQVANTIPENLTLCLEYPSPLTIENIYFRNFKGTTSKKYSPDIGLFACSSKEVCGNIYADNIDVVSPAGGNEASCLNVDESVLDVTCEAML